jgi:signal transduction histidine kinase
VTTHHALRLTQYAVRRLYASQAEQAGLAFHLEIEEGLPLVEGDASQLRHALGNLLDNALKFTPPGGTVSVGLRGHAGGVDLWVEDTGIGIPAGDLPHLFGRFHRSSNAAPYSGSGLGLAIVKAIAEAHGGQVSVENTRRGARFSMHLPGLVGTGGNS